MVRLKYFIGKKRLPLFSKLREKKRFKNAIKNLKKKQRKQLWKAQQNFDEKLNKEKEKVQCLEDAVESTKNNFQLLAKHSLRYNDTTSSTERYKTCIATGLCQTTKPKVAKQKRSKKTSDLLSGIPIFHEEDVIEIDNRSIGNGQFGNVKAVRLEKLNIVVACKTMSDETSSKDDVLSEAVVGLTISGEKYFPYVFGILSPFSILMEFIGDQETLEPAPTLYRKVKELKNFSQLKPMFIDALNSVMVLHSFKILHNDLKGDNFIFTNTCVKLVDFGKATHFSNPKTYNIQPGSDTAKKYNTYHRHIAYELRNIPGSKQSVQTDVFSLGHMLKHLSALVPCDQVVELGRSMKVNEPDFRIPIEKALTVLMKMT